MAPPEGEEEHSQAYYVIKVQRSDLAQWKYYIIDYRLHKSVRSCRELVTIWMLKYAKLKKRLERLRTLLDSWMTEMRHIEKALTKLTLQVQNLLITHKLNKIFKLLGEEVSELDSLEGQLRMVMDKFRRKRKLIKELQQDLQTMSNTLQSLNSDNSKYGAKTEDVKVSWG